MNNNPFDTLFQNSNTASAPDYLKIIQSAVQDRGELARLQRGQEENHQYVNTPSAPEYPNYIPSVVQDGSAIDRLQKEVEENHQYVKTCIQNDLNMRQLVEKLSTTQHEILNKIQEIYTEKNNILQQCEALCKNCCDRENEALRQAIGELRNEVEEIKQETHGMLENKVEHHVHKAMHQHKMDHHVGKFVRMLRMAEAERNGQPMRLVIMRGA